MSNIILDAANREKCPVRPSHVNTSARGLPFAEAFGNLQTEASAWYIVLLCQERGEWLPFTKDRIEESFQDKNKTRKERFLFGRLIADGWIVERENKYFITLQFVARVWASAPVL